MLPSVFAERSPCDNVKMDLFVQNCLSRMHTLKRGNKRKTDRKCKAGHKKNDRRPLQPKSSCILLCSLPPLCPLWSLFLLSCLFPSSSSSFIASSRFSSHYSFPLLLLLLLLLLLILLLLLLLMVVVIVLLSLSMNAQDHQTYDSLKLHRLLQFGLEIKGILFHF